MKFGLFGGARTKRTSMPGDSHGYEAFIDYVVEAEQLGYHSIFIVEHHFTGQGQVSASLTLLAYLAARTRSIRLGTAVVVLPWHNPVLLAEQVATLDLLSNGRFDFGVGKGYRPHEFTGFCIRQEEAAARFDEAIELIRKAWTTVEPFSHHSQHWHFEHVMVEPEPLQRPYPPLWLAAGSTGSIRRAARDGFNLLLDQLCSVDQAIERVAIFQEECRRIGRTYSPAMVNLARALQLTHSAKERAEALVIREKVLNNLGDLARGARPKRVEEDDAPLLGSPDEVIARIARLQAGGFENILLVDPQATVVSLRTFARDVIPVFTSDSMLPVRAAE